jgi:hypothetical protein
MSFTIIIMILVVSVGSIVGGTLAYKSMGKDPSDTFGVRLIIIAFGQIIGAFVGAIATVFVVAPVFLVCLIPLSLMGAYIFFMKNK